MFRIEQLRTEMQLTAKLQPPPTVGSAEKGRRRQRTPSLHLMSANADVALVDIGDIRALRKCSASTVYKEVSEGTFPQPVIRQPRYTRWTLASVRAWLKQQAQTPDPEAAARVIEQAHKATKAAQNKRRAARSEHL